VPKDATQAAVDFKMHEQCNKLHWETSTKFRTRTLLPTIGEISLF